MKLSVVEFLIIAAIVAILIAIFISPFASKNPDALERVAEDEGFAEKGKDGKAPFSDYELPGAEETSNGKSIAGLIGTILVFVISLGIAFVLKSKASSNVIKDKK